MKVFAMVMLRFAFVMLLSSLLRNGTLATLDELDKLENWKKSCQELAVSIAQKEPINLCRPNYINEMIMKPLTDLLNKVNNFSIGGMGKLLNRRLQKPLEIAISNCEKKILNEVEHSGQEDNNKYLEMLSSKTHSITKRIDKEFNTFIYEVVLELIEKVNWTSGKNIELGNKFYNFWSSLQAKESYCEKVSFRRVVIWTRENKSPRSENEVKDLLTHIFEAKLKILENELSEKIAGFAKQNKQIDVDGFMGFSDEFEAEWEQIEHKMITANIADKKIADTEKTFRDRLNELANLALKETIPLKKMITKKLGQLCPGPLKIILKKTFKSDQNKQKEEAKKKEIDAMKVIISDIGMFDGAANKLLVRFEHEEMDNTDFCGELEKAVKADKKMVSNAYQVKDKKLRRMK